MKTNKIYVQLLDGSTSWVPVNATEVSNNKYRILDDNEYTDYVDPLYIHEFYPGDIVKLGFEKLNDGKNQEVAKKLISRGQWQDRQFNEFKFKATLGLLKIDIITAEKYQEEIERIKEEQLTGQFYYPSLLETLDKLEKVKNIK